MQSKECSEMILKNSFRDNSARSCKPLCKELQRGLFFFRKGYFCNPANWLKKSSSYKIYRNMENSCVFPALKIEFFSPGEITALVHEVLLLTLVLQGWIHREPSQCALPLFYEQEGSWLPHQRTFYSETWHVRFDFACFEIFLADLFFYVK